MKKIFFTRLAAFALAVLLLFAVALGLSAVEPFRTPLAELTGSTGYDAAATAEISPHIANVQAADGATRLILGDSVCWQICDPFNKCNTDYRIDGSNRAITLAGQYLLAEAFLAAHPDTAELYLMVGPEAFSAGFGTQYGYQYAVAPFAQAGLLKNLDETTLQEMRRAYGGFFLRAGTARWLDASPLGNKLYLNLLRALPQEAQEPVLNDMAARSLQRIAELCAARGVAFHLMCVPLADTTARRDAMDALEQAFREAGLYDPYAAYFTDLPLYDQSLFNEDGIHFDSEQVGIDFFTQVLEKLKADTGLLGGLVTTYNS